MASSLPPVPVPPSSAGRPARHHQIAAPEPLDGFSAEDLRQRLISQPVIDQAKGVLMGRYRCSGDAAFAMLQRWSMAENVKVRVLAAGLVDAVQQPDGVLDGYLAERNPADQPARAPRV